MNGESDRRLSWNRRGDVDRVRRQRTDQALTITGARSATAPRDDSRISVQWGKRCVDDDIPGVDQRDEMGRFAELWVVLADPIDNASVCCCT